MSIALERIALELIAREEKQRKKRGTIGLILVLTMGMVAALFLIQVSHAFAKDLDWGDGDSDLPVDAFVSATVDFDPETLNLFNLKSESEWINAYLEFEGDVADIDSSTIMLNDLVPTEEKTTEIMSVFIVPYTNMYFGGLHYQRSDDMEKS